MYNWSYILHIVGVALWLGSFFGFGYLLRGLAKDGEKLKDYSLVIKKIQRWVMFGIQPSLMVILLTGVYMILQFNRDSLPLYLTLMEMGGGTIILITIILVSIFSVRLSKKLQGVPSKKEKSLASLTKLYANFLLVSMLLGIAIVVIVGLRIV